MIITYDLKQTKEYDWSKIIRPELMKLYGSSNEFNAEIDAINQYRIDCTSNPAPTSQTRDALYRYLAQIDFLSLHIPLHTSDVEFSWGGGSIYSPYMSHPSVAYEKACVLFNLGTVISKMGETSFDAEDFKSAYQLFSSSAGVFKYAGDNCAHTASLDVGPTMLGAFCKLMLAQAQYCFYLKAKQGNTPPALLAKLAQSASNLYASTHETLLQLVNSNVRIYVKLGQVYQMKCKLKLEAHYTQAKTLEKSHKMGAAIAHLKGALDLVEDDKKMRGLIESELKVMENDNHMIYHDPIPSPIPEIPETQVAKPLDMGSWYPSPEQAEKVVGRDLFERIIHISIHEKASLYSEMKAQYLRDQIEKSDVAKLELTSALEYMNLQSTISHLRRDNSDLIEVPADIVEYSLTVSSACNPYTVHGIRTNFSEQRERIRNLLRSQVSTEVTTRVKQELLNVSNYENDLQPMFAAINKNISILEDPKNLQKAYKECAQQAESSAGATLGVSLIDLDESKGIDLKESLNTVSDLAAKLQKIMRERNSSIQQLRESIHNNDDEITRKLIPYQNDLDRIEDEVLKPELLKFDPIVKRIDATIRLQKAVLNDTISKWKVILESKEAKTVLAKQSSIVSSLENLSEELRSTFHQWNATLELSQRIQSIYAKLERDSLNLDGSNSNSSASRAAPQKPPKNF